MTCRLASSLPRVDPPLTLHQRQFRAWLLQRKAASDSVGSLASTLVDAQVDLNPHQVEAALFACQNPLSKGVILADEVGLGKTIEAGLVISQRWAERRRRIVIIVPANLRKPSKVIGRTLRDALAGVHSKVLLTATPLQNSLLELHGLVSLIDERVFGNLDSFRAQFGQLGKQPTFDALRARLAPLCKGTLRRDIQPCVSYTQRRALVQDFTPTHDERQLSALVADYLPRPDLQVLLQGLDRAFAELARLNAQRKAIIFTESRRTQGYLLSLLEGTPCGEGIVLFNGTNSDEPAQVIYRNWIKRHEGTDRSSGSKTADTRAALVERFRDEGTVMIATETGAEGINLQFCSLAISYDLPWNPQRIEQRVGRCHRYGQKHDVAVVNFVDRSNEADRRVYEMLGQKSKLFEGVFGASDEVLGAIGSVFDVERRIGEIYRPCRSTDDIRTGFEQSQLDLSGEINEAMVRRRQTLLENFDDEVHEKVRLRAAQGAETRNRFERMLMQLTQDELGDAAEFDGESAR